MNDNVALMGTL